MRALCSSEELGAAPLGFGMGARPTWWCDGYAVAGPTACAHARARAPIVHFMTDFVGLRMVTPRRHAGHTLMVLGSVVGADRYPLDW